MNVVTLTSRFSFSAIDVAVWQHDRKSHRLISKTMAIGSVDLQLGLVSEHTFTLAVVNEGTELLRSRARQEIAVKKRNQKIEQLEPMVLMSASAIGTDSADVINDIDGADLLLGRAGDDTLIAMAGDSVLIAGEGDDRLISIRGCNVLEGGAGQDTVQYFADRSEFTIEQGDNGSLIISAVGRHDTLVDVEFVQFEDGLYSTEALLAEVIPSIDGSNNNLLQTDFGSTHTELIRLADAEYGDQIGELVDDRPSAREVSNAVVASDGDVGNDRDLSNMVWAWGQFIDHDLSLTEASSEESADVVVPTGDPFFDPAGTGAATIAFTRSEIADGSGVDATDPREHENSITAYLDGSMIYGSDDDRASSLRTFESGFLKIEDNGLLIENTEDLANDNGPTEELSGAVLAGDIRANENVVLTSLHTLWVREHNRIATDIASQDSSLTDEQIYQRARALVVAELQVITYNEFLPALLGESALADYAGYDNTVNPGISTEFSTAAFRLGHSMLTEQIQRLDADGEAIDEGHILLRDAFFDPTMLDSIGIDPLLRGAMNQEANELDNEIIDSVRNFLFGPPGAGGFDLASLNIQRGRDHGLSDYNTTRIAIGLDAVNSFADMTSDIDLQQKLEQLYGSVDNVDLWVGGLAEDHVDGSSVGETFRAILVDQFSRLRDGDRFWYENRFSDQEIAALNSTTLADVIARNTDVSEASGNVFFVS